jgi:hypothetical protein
MNNKFAKQKRPARKKAPEKTIRGKTYYFEFMNNFSSGR